MKKGFTLLELIIVIIVLGILATLGFTQYTRVVERGRTAEAKTVLGQIRTAQQAYYLEYGSYAASIDPLLVNAPQTTCASTHYFIYRADNLNCEAVRCTASSGGGKTPAAATAYNVTLNYTTGAFGGTSGYY